MTGSGCDPLDDYMNRVRKRLSRGEREPILTLAEVLLFPAFHAESLLRVVESSEGTICRLVTLSSSLWYSDGDSIPTRHQEAATVAPERSDRFWISMSQLAPGTITSAATSGCDGMSVYAAFREQGVSTSFSTWSPDPRSPSGKFIRLIYELAQEILKAPESIVRLEQIHGYL